MMYGVGKIVWIDETGSDNRNCQQRYSYHFQGLRAVKESLMVLRGHVIATISQQGLTDYQLVTSTIDSNIFWDFVRGSVIPTMLPFDRIRSA